MSAVRSDDHLRSRDRIFNLSVGPHGSLFQRIVSPIPRDVKKPFQRTPQIFLQQNFHCFLPRCRKRVYILISFRFHALCRSLAEPLDVAGD